MNQTMNPFFCPPSKKMSIRIYLLPMDSSERLDNSEELKNAGYAEIEIDRTNYVASQGSLEKYPSLCIRVLIFKPSIPHDHGAREH